MWQDLWVATALMLVIEGLIPFVSPGSFRQALETAAQLDDRTLRRGGLICMLVGVGLLYMVRA